LGLRGGRPSVVPCTVTFEVPLPQGGRSTVTTTAVDVRGRRSAMPDGAGNVVMSMTLYRRRVTFPPVLFTTVRRMSSVPKVELFAGSLVKSRTRLGAADCATHVSSRSTANEALRSIGDERFSGPGAPRRWPAPAEVPLVSTKMKSAALLLVSSTFELVGPAVVWIRPTVVQFPPPPDPVHPPVNCLRVNE